MITIRSSVSEVHQKVENKTFRTDRHVIYVQHCTASFSRPSWPHLPLDSSSSSDALAILGCRLGGATAA